MKRVLCVGLLVAAMGACSSMSVEKRREINLRRAQEVEGHLMAVVVDPFFGRAVDSEHGGFVQGFDREWKSTGDPSARFSVFQARATYAASAVAEQRKGLALRFKPIAEHGFKELRDVIWDEEMGGFYWGRRADGAAMEKYGEQKMAYSQAFGIYALAAYYGATKDAAGLKLAREAFAWFDKHGHDGRNGGYFEVMRRDGSRVTGAGDSAFGGWPLSLKTSNSSLHVLEALLELYRVDPDPTVRLRLLEMFELVRDRIVLKETGSMGEKFADDWTPASKRASYGHDVEAAHLLLSAAKALGLTGDPRTEAVARRLVDNALDLGFDWDRGGVFENEPEGKKGRKRPKVWWAQAEMLLALAVMEAKFGKDDGKYADAYALQWKALNEDFTDRTFVGRVKAISADGRRDWGKVDDWTEAYHDVRCLLGVSAVLRGRE